MPTISVVYPYAEGATFDYDYYVNSHLAKVKSNPDGKVTALRGHPGPDGVPPAFFAIVLIEFAQMEDFIRSMSAPGAASMQADVANFTTVQPLVQVNDVLPI